VGASAGQRRPVPTVIRIHGYRYFFYSNEGSEPPHVHVERAHLPLSMSRVLIER
jgi:hypothetical protein